MIAAASGGISGVGFFGMRKPGTFDDKTHQEFIQLFGLAMEAWAELERELGTLFVYISRINADMGTAIFYSSRSFSGRIDMFKAALSRSRASKRVKTMSSRIVKRCMDFNQHRNSLAHNLPTRDKNGKIILVHGKFQFQDNKTKKDGIELATTMGQLKIIVNNFAKLAEIIKQTWIGVSMRSSLDKYRKRLVRLPTDPRLKVQPQTAARRSRQRPSSRR
jgi:hypothetical protein